MYFSDLWFSRSAPKVSYIHGNNDGLKTLAVELIHQRLGSPDKVTVGKNVLISQPTNIFTTPILYIIDDTSTIHQLPAQCIKVSKKKPTKKELSQGFTEIICSNLFPSQVERILKEELGDPSIISSDIQNICAIHGYDLISVLNFTKLWGYSKLYNVNHSTNVVLSTSTNLSLPSSAEVVDAVLSSNFQSASLEIRRLSPKSLREALWALLSVLIKIHSISPGMSKQWQEKRLEGLMSRVGKAKIIHIIQYLQNIVSDYTFSHEYMVSKCIRAMLYLQFENSYLEDTRF